ncbi:UDP-glycosyltransferase UGT5-like [Spodoptera frugiperda]|uniref:UDP-glucuronosyltransferase n=1 Tax=Spodoptera frugiperda TaxID=7108 RepID=A0A9R0EX80_SPOFR|nr:UDP-glycosyltransferase UGT5-like [Spodoptera frugiperda]
MSQFPNIQCFIFSALLEYFVESARILAVLPVPSISHQIVYRPLTQELARRGHEVTVITPDPAFPKGKTPPNLTEIDVHDSYKIWTERLNTIPENKERDALEELEIFLDLGYELSDAQLSHEDVKALIKNKKEDYFDLLIIESCETISLGYSHIFTAPVILISSLSQSYDEIDMIGAAIHPILYTSIHKIKNSYDLTPWDKIKELYNYYKYLKIYERDEIRKHVMLKKHFGAEVPSISVLKNNIDMFFINVNPIFEGVRPVPPSVVYIGGLHRKPTKELPMELKSYLDSSKYGVIYISFGTNVDPTLLPADRIEVLVKTLSQLPYDILWKWNGDVLPGRTDNIRIAKWLPQQDLLRHPKVKLFITQGGLQSTDEAIIAGVPLIGIPMFGDQRFNVERYVYHKIGVKLDMDTLTVEEFKNAIETVIGNESYRQNVVSLRNKMYDQPQPPLERAVWWTEHVLRHGGARHLRGPAANMSWAEYLELELVFTLLLGLLTVLLFSILVLYLIWQCVLTKYLRMRIKCE